MPRETFGARPLATVSTIHLGADSLRLEVLPAHLDVFTEYDYNSVSVKVHLYDAAANDFSPAHIFTIPSRNDKLRIVKYQLAHEYGLPPDGIRLFKESVASVYSDPVNSSGTVELFGDECVGFVLLLCFCESSLTLVHTRVCVVLAGMNSSSIPCGMARCCIWRSRWRTRQRSRPVRWRLSGARMS